jgi:cytochrome c biogenesis protein CcdA
LPVVTGVALVVMGVLTLVGRMPLMPERLMERVASGSGGGVVRAEGMGGATSSVKVPEATSRPACCVRE